MNTPDYISLKDLPNHAGYKILENEWLYQVGKIEEARDKAAKRSGESAWRYWAGQEAGFKLAVTTLARTLSRMEAEAEEQSQDQESVVDKLLKEIKQ